MIGIALGMHLGRKKHAPPSEPPPEGTDQCLLLLMRWTV